MNKSHFLTAPRLLTLSSLALIFSASSFARSPDNQGIYFGGGYSQVKIKDAEDFDDENDAYNLFVGTQFNSIFAFEAGYIDFGSYGSNVANASTDGYTLAFKAGIPLSDSFDIYAQAGQLWWETEYDIVGIDGKLDGNEPFYGVGVSFGLSDNLHLRLEYNRYKVEFEEDETGPLTGAARDADLDQANVALALYF